MAGSSAAIRAGKAFVEIGAKDKLSRTLDRLGRRMRAFGAGVQEIGLRIAGAGLAISAAFGAAVTVFRNTGDALDKMSKRTGISVETLSELSHIAAGAGTNIETVEGAVRQMQRVITDAAAGSKEAADALAALGLSASSLAGLSPEEQLMRVADAIDAIPDPSRKAAAAMEVLGRSGTALILMFEGGSAAIREQQKELQRLGLTITAEQAARAAKLDDALSMLWATARNVAFQVGDALAPAFTELADAAKKVLATVGKWVKQNKPVIILAAKVATMVTAAGVALIGIGTAFSVAGVLVSVFAGILGTVVTAFKLLLLTIPALLSPLGAVVVAVGGLGAFLIWKFGEAGETIEWLGEKFRAVADIAREAWQGITDALTAGDLDMAVQIAWQGLKVAALDATQEIYGVFSEFFKDLTEAWEATMADLETAMAVGKLKDLRAEATKFMNKATAAVENGPPMFASASPLAAAFMAYNSADTGPLPNMIDQANKADQAGLPGQLSNIATEAEKKIAAAQKAHADRLADATAALIRSQMALADLIEAAALARKKAQDEAAKQASSAASRAGAEVHKIKNSAVGQFGSAAAFGLAVGGETGTVSEIQKTNKFLWDILKQDKRIEKAIIESAARFG